MATKEWTPTPGDLLRQAAVIAEEWGTCKGQFMDGDGRVCEVGALRAAAGIDSHVQRNGKWGFGFIANLANLAWYSIFTDAWRALQDVGGGTQHNDQVAKSDKDRINKLLEAAAYADKQEKL